jgi:hypothetical protein
MTKAQKAEQREAIDQLRQWIKPGDTVYTILDHVSTSGMSRAIRVLVPSCQDGSVDFIHPNYATGKALGLRHWKRNGHEQDALVVGGCGMDMGFHLVYELSSVLYGGRLTTDIYKDEASHDKPGGQLLTRDGAPEGQVYIGGYHCLGKGKCPSNYHNNHRDTIQCYGTEEHPRCSWTRGVGWVLDDGSICPTCKGEGRIPNPDGPERFDLLHTDGYALRHRWL